MALQENLGLIMAQSGDIGGARSELEAAIKLDPGDRDTRYALDVMSRRQSK